MGEEVRFRTRGVTLQAHIAGQWRNVDRAGGGSLTLDEIAAGITSVNEAYLELDVRRYGAVGDDATDCLAAFNAAYAVAVVKSANDHGAEVFVPEGKFRLSDEWNVWRVNSPRRDIVVRGVDQLNSVLVADFYGASKAIIKCVDPAGVSRASPLSIRDIGFENVSTSGGVNPLFVDILGWGESRIERVRLASSNNTHLRAVSAQNVRGTDVVSFFGGRHFNYKDTDGLTFSVNTTANTITCTNGTPFSAGDVGKYFFIFPSDVSRRIRYTINSFSSTSVVGYAEVSGDLAQTDVEGHFEPARCSMTSSDTTLVANANCFTADMVGLVVYVRGARVGAYGNALLRGVITQFNAANSVELDVAAGATVTDVYFAVPCFDFGLPSGWAGSSDVMIDKLHIEHYDGVAVVAQNTDQYVLQGKIHGETQPGDTTGSMSAMWLDDFGGQLSITLDSSCSLSDCRVHCSNFNDLLMFDAMWSRHIINGKLIVTDLFTDDGGYVVVRGLNMYDNATVPEDLISDANHTADANDARVLFDGVVNMLTDTQEARNYVGRNTYFMPNGDRYSNGILDKVGAGSPEGAVTAPIGSTYRRTDGGASTSWYVKESGAGNTGWVAK